jgi:hypothetical protein
MRVNAKFIRGIMREIDSKFFNLVISDFCLRQILLYINFFCNFVAMFIFVSILNAKIEVLSNISVN